MALADAQHATVGQVKRALKKATRADRIHRLRSLQYDAAYVRAAADALQVPTFANLRCGVWYVPPDLCNGTCYFRSHDGHYGSWDFSLSRINLQVALAAGGAAGAAAVVDATRSGKRFPDALSKTVPVWCTVVNRAVVATRQRQQGGCVQQPPETWSKLWLPPWVPMTEASQIEERLDGWVRRLLSPSMRPIVAKLCATLQRPLRPYWIYAGDAVVVPDSSFTKEHHLVFCISASRALSTGAARELFSWTYVQGAGDDEEHWARGLSPGQWWRWGATLCELAATSPAQAEEELGRLQAAEALESASCDDAPLASSLLGSGLFVGNLAAAQSALTAGSDAADVGAVLYLGMRNVGHDVDGQMPFCSIAVADGVANGVKAQPSRMHWQIRILPVALRFIDHHLRCRRRVLIACDRGADYAPTVAAAALIALFCDDCETMRRREECTGGVGYSKEVIRARVGMVLGCHPSAHLQRAHVKELTCFFAETAPKTGAGSRADIGGWTSFGLWGAASV